MSSAGNCINHMHLNFIENHFGCSDWCSDSGTKQPQGFKLGCHGWRWIICFLFFQIVIFCVSLSLPWASALCSNTQCCTWVFTKSCDLSMEKATYCPVLCKWGPGTLKMNVPNWWKRLTSACSLLFYGSDDRALLHLKGVFWGLLS